MSGSGSWDEFVRNTPIGFIPVGITGAVRVYQIACGPFSEIRKHFAAVATKAYWPDWVIESDPADVRREAGRARRAERTRQAATKNYPPPQARRRP